MQSQWLSRQPFWLVLILILAGLNALILNDVNAIMPGAEARVAVAIERISVEWPFLFRLPSSILFFACLGTSYWIGKRFFGKEASLLTLFVLAGSLLVVNAAKWATGDMGLLLLLLLASLSMLGHLKQDRRMWRFLFWGSGLLALFLQPVWALVSVLSIALFWRFRHPVGKRLDSLYLWIGAPFFAVLFWWLQGGEWSSPFFYWSWILEMGGWVIGTQGLGMLPWVGFLAAGLVEVWRNQRKGEELSILLGGLLLGGLLGGTLLVQWVFALLVAKQLQRFLAPGYPYENLVKTLTILLLLSVLLGGIIGMIYGYVELGAAGFRMGMSLILAFWIPGLFGAIGLFGRNQKLTVLGTAIGVLLFSLALWTQAGPLIESYLNL